MERATDSSLKLALLARNTDHLTVFRGFPQSVQANSGIVY